MRSRNLNLQRWMKALAGVVTVLLLMVWEHVEALRLEKRVKQLRQEADRLVYDNSRLQMQINQWSSLSHLERLAKERYRMGLPAPDRLIGIEP